MDTKEACDYLGICDKSLRARIKAGEIVPSKIGRLNRFRKTDLDAFLSQTREIGSQSVVVILEMDNEEAAKLMTADASLLQGMGVRCVRPAGSV